MKFLQQTLSIRPVHMFDTSISTGTRKSVQLNQEDPSTRACHKSLYTRALPHVRESTKVLDSGSRPLDSSFLDSGIHTIVDSRFHTIVDSRFQTIVDSGLQSSGFRIPTAKNCWIPDSLTWGKELVSSRFRAHILFLVLMLASFM